MPTKTVMYKRVKFRAEDIKETVARYLSKVPAGTEFPFPPTRQVDKGNTQWRFDNDDEFYSEYRGSDTTEAVLRLHGVGVDFALHYFSSSGGTAVGVELPQRGQIEAVFEVLEAVREDCFIPSPQPPLRIFIGHCRSPQWRDLKDHLHEKHRLSVDAYETGARAGYSITEFLENVQRDATFAILVHTAEDEDSSGGMHARENVVHETGLFQGRLSFRRAIVLREDGCREFSNLAGIQEIRYSKGNIRETFGEVLATIKREFGD
jgi:hypothetical protein